MSGKETPICPPIAEDNDLSVDELLLACNPRDRSAPNVVVSTSHVHVALDPVKDTSMVEEDLKTSENVPKLPDEILDKIIGYLPLAYRKICRLVCSKWFNMCSRYDKNEKISISSAYNQCLEKVLSILSNLTRSCSEFEFYGLDFGNNPAEVFWRTCGPKMSVLKLISCKMSSSSYMNLLQHCSNLQTLEFHFDKFEDMLIGLPKRAPAKILPSRLKIPSLTTFNVQFYSHEKSSETPRLLRFLLRLLHAFPNISCFSIGQYELFVGSVYAILEYIDMMSDDGDEAMDYKDIEGRFHKFLGPRLENALTCLSYPGFHWDVLMGNAGNFRNITEFAFDLDEMCILNKSSFSEFILQQENLRKITCTARRQYNAENDMKMLLSFFSKISNLRDLRLLLLGASLCWKDNWSNLIGASNLETFRIICNEIDFSTCGSGLSSCYTNLISLAVGSDRMKDSNNLVPLIKSFPSLRTLHLSYVNNDILNCVCTTQIQLRSLSVEQTEQENGPITSSLLNHLIHLEALELPESMISQSLCLESLKYLNIRDRKLDKPKDNGFNLNILLTYRLVCPSLEALCIDRIFFTRPEFDKISKYETYKQWFISVVAEFVEDMKNLKLLNICVHFSCIANLEADFTEDDVSVLFNRCPSLRVFVLGDVYVKDPIHGCIYRKPKSGSLKVEFVKKYVNMDVEWGSFFNRSIFFE